MPEPSLLQQFRHIDIDSEEAFATWGLEAPTITGELAEEEASTQAANEAQKQFLTAFKQGGRSFLRQL